MSKMATIEMGGFISAQGTIIETHENGEVTIDASPARIRCVPIAKFQNQAARDSQNKHMAS